MGRPAAATTFVGRARELGVLADAYDGARAGRPSTVLVCGEAGLGKSRLVARFTDRARDHGARVLIGGCLPMGQSLPFTAVVEALRALTDEVGADPLRRLVGNLGRDLRRLLPTLGPAPTGPVGDEDDDGASQARLFEAVLGLLTRLGRDRPHVLVLEDLHWADRSTRDLLLFLSHNLRDAGVLVLATVRDDEVDGTHPLRPVLARLSREDRTQRVDLAPLTRDEVADLIERLLAAPPRRDLVDLVAARAAGNPFFIEELVAAGPGTGLSATLREVLLARLEVLPEDTRRVLRLAAAAGRRVPHDLLARAGDLDDERLDGALRSAVDRHVLLADLDSATYTFRHDLLAEAVETTLLPGERRRLHRALADVLDADPALATGTPAAELAHHWHIAGDRPRALRTSYEAAREAVALRATGEALLHVDRVIALWDQVPDVTELIGLDRAGMLAWQADLAHDTGEVRRSIDVMRGAMAALPDDADPARLGRMWERLGRYVTSADGPPAATEAIERAAALVPATPPSTLRARIMLLRAHVGWETDPATSLAIAREQLDVVTRLGEREVEGVARTLVGSCLAALGELDEGVEHLREATAIADERGSAEDLARAHNLWSAVLIRGGRVADGAEVALAGLARVGDLGVERVWGPMLAGNATSGLFWAGRWDEAQALAAEVVGDGIGVGWLLLLQTRLLAHRGRFREARDALAEADRFGGTTEPRRRGVVVSLEALAGDLDAAHAAILQRHAGAAPFHAATVNELAAWALRVEAERVATGAATRECVRALADQLRDETTMHNGAGVAHAEPWRRTALAEHARLVDPGSSVQPWRDAVAAWETLGWSHPLAYARFRLADALTAADGATDEVAVLLQDAHGRAAALGAQPLLSDIVRLGRRAGVPGVRSAPPTRAGRRVRPYGLTAREQEVLELVVAGRTNPEVGRVLHITEKTASVHVSNILRKLEVTSRTEAAAVAVREGLTAG